MTVRPAGRLWLAAAIGVGALLRLYRLAAWDLALDEGFTFGTSAKPPTAIWSSVAQQDPFHPPFYYVILHFWRLLGDSDVVLRLLSVLLGTLSIWLLFRVGAYLCDRRTGVLAAFILAVSPFHIWHSQEARMYAAVFFFSLVAFDSLARLVHEGRARQWLVYIGAATLSLYTEYGAFLALAAHNVAVAVLRTIRLGPPLLRWTLAQATILALFLPWLPVLLDILVGLGAVPIAPQERPVHSGPAWLRTAGDLGFSLATLTSAFLPQNTPLLKVIAILAVGTAAVVGFRSLAGQPTSRALLGALVIVPPVLGVVLSYKLQVLFPRMLIGMSAAYYLLTARGISSIGRRGYASLAFGTLMALNLYSLHTMYRIEKAPPWRQVATHVATRVQPGEGILFVHGRWRWVFGRYYEGPAVEIDGLEASPGFERTLRFVDKQTGLFLVLKDAERSDPQRRLRDHVRSRLSLEGRTVFPGSVVVERYRRPGGNRKP